MGARSPVQEPCSRAESHCKSTMDTHKAGEGRRVGKDGRKGVKGERRGRETKQIMWEITEPAFHSTEHSQNKIV